MLGAYLFPPFITFCLVYELVHTRAEHNDIVGPLDRPPLERTDVRWLPSPGFAPGYYYLHPFITFCLPSEHGARCAPRAHTHTHTAMRSGGDPPARTMWLPLLTNMRHSLRRAVWRTRTQHLVPPPSAHLCTRRPSLHLTMLHTPSFSAGSALVTYSPAHARLCGKWLCCVGHKALSSSRLHHRLRAHTRSPCARGGCRHPPMCAPHALRAGMAPRCRSCCRPPCLCLQPLIPPALPRCRS